MIRALFLCLTFILTNSVMAQASFSPADLGIARLEPNSWKATHAGALQLDGLHVIAALETVENEIKIPEIMANSLQTLVPLVPVKEKGFRLVIAVSENPSLAARFELDARTVSVDGTTRFAYVSSNPDADFQFLILAQEDGSYHATFTRKLGESEVEQGEFTLAPLPHILQE